VKDEEKETGKKEKPTQECTVEFIPNHKQIIFKPSMFLGAMKPPQSCLPKDKRVAYMYQF
jgi:hypothetical protein